MALAYVDQLKRGGNVAPATLEALSQALGQARTAVDSRAKDPALAERLLALAGTVNAGGDDATVKRVAALRETLGGIAALLR